MPTSQRPASKKRQSQPHEPPLQPFGGRMVVAAGLLFASGVINLPLLSQQLERYAANFETVIDKPADQKTWEPGKIQEVGVTLISADFDKLACAYERPVSGVHCQYKTQTELWPVEPNAPLDDNKKNIIQPFSLVPDNQLILMAGIWAQPAVAYRIHQEPATTIAQKRQARFIAKCRVKPLEQIQGASIRWESTAQWGKASVVLPNNQGESNPWVVSVESCDIVDED